VKDGAVFTFLENDNFLVFFIQGKEVVPFWSSPPGWQRSRRPI
jgi:hypothetical protein